MKVRVPFLIRWGYAGPRGGPVRVSATLYVLRDPFRYFRSWPKAPAYQQMCVIFRGIKDGDKLIPAKRR